MVRRLATAALCALVMTGCNILSPDDDAKEDPQEGVIMPLKVGNTWIYRTLRYDDAGMMSSSTLDTLTILAEVGLGGESWFQGSDGVLYRNAADGLHHSSISDCHCLIAKYPAEVGETFGIDSIVALLPDQSGPTTIGVGLEVASRKTRVTVPAGSYACYLYQGKLPSSGNYKFIHGPARSYYAPNIGCVRTDVPDSSHVRELVSVSLK